MSMWRTLLENALLRNGVFPEPFLSMNIWGKNAEFRGSYIVDRYGLYTGYSELISEDPEYIKEFYRNKAVPKPGALDFLDHLKSAGVKIATPLIYMESALEKYGIIKYLDVILTTKDIGVGKNKPDIYDISCQRLHVSKDKAIIFEDANYAIKTAKLNGYHVIAIDDYWQFRKRQENIDLADKFITDWSEVYSLIRI